MSDKRRVWHGFMREPETGTVWGKPIWRTTVKDSPIDDEMPCVLMEATPEGVGPFTEQMLYDLNTAIFRLEGKWPTDSEADRLREVQTAIRRVLDAGGGGRC